MSPLFGELRFLIALFRCCVARGIAGFVGNPAEIIMVRMQGDYMRNLQRSVSTIKSASIICLRYAAYFPRPYLLLLCFILNTYSLIGITLPFMSYSSSSTFLFISLLNHFLTVLPLFMSRCSGKKAYRASRACDSNEH